MSVLVLGSINTDLVIRGPRLPRPGETVLCGEFYQAAGGKGANQAVAAARALNDERKVLFIAAVGDDAFGPDSLRALADDCIDCSHIKIVPGCPSGIALILVDERGENLISVASGANARLMPGDIDAVPDAVFRGCKVFLACLESPLPAVEHGLKRAKKLGLLTILNPAPVADAAAVLKLLPLIDVLTPNEHELADLAGMPVASYESAVAAARQLQSVGARQIILTLGGLGAAAVDERGTACHIAPVPVAAVDATAAGDCFCGALAVALTEGKSLFIAARFATAAAAISVTRRGAQPSLPRREEIDELLRKS